MGLVLGWSLLGGLHVAALMASRSYLMGAQIFFRREGGAAAAHCFAALGLLYVLRREIVAGAEKLAAHSVGGAPVRRALRRLPAAVGGLVRGAFPAWNHPAQRVGDGLLCRPRSKALPGGALRAAVPVGLPEEGAVLPVLLRRWGVSGVRFRGQHLLPRGWRRWGCP